MKQHWNLDREITSFILSSEELKLVNARYKRTRIGFAALLKYFQLFHQFPTKKVKFHLRCYTFFLNN